MRSGEIGTAGMEENKKSKGFVLIFFLVGIVTAAAGYFYGKEYLEVVRNVILSLLGMGTILYLLEYEGQSKGLDYDNAEHKERFFLIFFISLLCAVVFPFIPAAGWPYLAIFIVLSLFSNSLVGLVAGALLLMITLMYGNGTGIADFFIYFIVGAAGIILFRQLDETYKVGARVFLSLITLFVALSAGYVLLVNEVFSIQLFLIPVINFFMNLLLIMIILKYFSFAVIHKYRERYMDLNDQEFPLLVSLKEKNMGEYFHAVHTAYLCDQAAKQLGLDEVLLKAGGYYHRIGVVKGENTWENIEEVSKEYKFPPKLVRLLREYNHKEEALVSKEAVVLKLADTVISVVGSMFRKDANVILNYPLLMDAIFRKKIESGVLDGSEITMQEINRIKKVLLEEKLYYDFLR